MADADNATLEATEDKLEQTVTIEDIGPAFKRITIEVPESRIKEKVEDTYGGLQDEAVLPGFRRGRAPRRLIEKRFGEDIRKDVKSQLLTESYTQAIEENDLDVLGAPDVKDAETLEVPDSGDFKFTVEVEVTPNVDLPEFGDIKVEKKKAEATDEAITEEIDNARERFGSMTDVSDGQVAEDDYVQAAVKILAGEDADPDAEGDDAAEVLNDTPMAYILVHGEKHEYKGHVVGIVVSDMGKRLIGKDVGHREVISMTGPSGHEDEKIKDQPITIVIDVKLIQRVEPCPMEDLQARLGVESEDELKERVRTMIEQRSEQQQKSDMYQQVTDYLLEKVELELPEKLTNTQTQRVLQRHAMELMYQGKTEQEVQAAVADMREGSAKEMATKQLRQFFILDKAAKDLEIEVEENEINGRIAGMAMQQGRRPEKMRQELAQRGGIEQLFLQIRESKTLDAIIEKADVTEVDKPVGEDAK